MSVITQVNQPTDADASSPDKGEEARRYSFQARGGAKEFLGCQEPEVVLSGPSGTGKSYTSLNKLWMIAKKYPGSRCAIVRKFRSTITQSAMVTFEEKVCVPGSGIKFNTVDQQYNFPKDPNTGQSSAIVVAGLDDPTKILSTEFDVIYVQECTEIEESTWEMLKTRLRWGRVPYQQLIGDCNPDSERHWIKRREKSGKLKLISSQHTDNPAFWDAERSDWTPAGVAYIANLKQMSGHMFERFYLGNWVGAEGMIYTEYDYKRNLIEPFKLPKEWKRYVSVDFGFTNPFVAQWWAEDNDGRLYLYREVYGTQTTVEDWGHVIYDLSKGEKYEAVICDHDAEDRATLERHMMHPVEKCIAGRTKEFHKVPTERRGTIGADKARDSVMIGIQEVQNRFRKAGDGRPRLFLFRNTLAMPPDERLVSDKKPTCTEEEIDAYVWDQITNGRLGDRILEQPKKVNDHGMDSLRYLVHYLDGKTSHMSASIFGKSVRHSYAGMSDRKDSPSKLDFFKTT